MSDSFYKDSMRAEDIMSFQSGIAAFETKQFVRAYDLLRPLAQAHHPESQYRLAIMLQNGLGMVKNEPEAFRWMKAAADQGLDVAQHGLGFMYLQGECVQQNDQAAAHWFQLAAQQDLAGAQMMLGDLYKEGRGVEKDLEKSQYWYEEAAKD